MHNITIFTIYRTMKEIQPTTTIETTTPIDDQFRDYLQFSWLEYGRIWNSLIWKNSDKIRLKETRLKSTNLSPKVLAFEKKLQKENPDYKFNVLRTYLFLNLEEHTSDKRRKIIIINKLIRKAYTRLNIDKYKVMQDSLLFDFFVIYLAKNPNWNFKQAFLEYNKFYKNAKTKDFIKYNNYIQKQDEKISNSKLKISKQIVELKQNIKNYNENYKDNKINIPASKFDIKNSDNIYYIYSQILKQLSAIYSQNLSTESKVKMLSDRVDYLIKKLEKLNKNKEKNKKYIQEIKAEIKALSEKWMSGKTIEKDINKWLLNLSSRTGVDTYSQLAKKNIDEAVYKSIIHYYFDFYWQTFQVKKLYDLRNDEKYKLPWKGPIPFDIFLAILIYQTHLGTAWVGKSKNNRAWLRNKKSEMINYQYCNTSITDLLEKINNVRKTSDSPNSSFIFLKTIFKEEQHRKNIRKITIKISNQRVKYKAYYKTVSEDPAKSTIKSKIKLLSELMKEQKWLSTKIKEDTKQSKSSQSELLKTKQQEIASIKNIEELLALINKISTISELNNDLSANKDLKIKYKEEQLVLIKNKELDLINNISSFKLLLQHTKQQFRKKIENKTAETIFLQNQKSPEVKNDYSKYYISLSTNIPEITNYLKNKHLTIKKLQTRFIEKLKIVSENNTITWNNYEKKDINIKNVYKVWEKYIYSVPNNWVIFTIYGSKLELWSEYTWFIQKDWEKFYLYRKLKTKKLKTKKDTNNNNNNSVDNGIDSNIISSDLEVTLFTDKLSSQFQDKLNSISSKLWIPANWIAIFIMHESWFNPKAQNSICASWLLQFMPQHIDYYIKKYNEYTGSNISPISKEKAENIVNLQRWTLDNKWYYFKLEEEIRKAKVRKKYIRENQDRRTAKRRTKKIRKMEKANKSKHEIDKIKKISKNIKDKALKDIDINVDSSWENYISSKTNQDKLKKLAIRRVQMLVVTDMTDIEQLDLIYVFLKDKFKWKKVNSITELWTLIFWPPAFRHLDDNAYILWWYKNSAVLARQNPLFDTNKDWKITIWEYKEFWNKKIKKIIWQNKY